MSSSALPESDPGVIDRRQQIVDDLRRLVPDTAGVIADHAGRRAYEADALTAYRQMPLAVVLPTSTEQVSAVLAYCHRESIKVVARGAGTSLSGAALPQADAIVLGISRMNEFLEVNGANRTARVQAGITNLAISERVVGRGLHFAPDPSSQMACTLAGNLALNAGGARGLKYGATTNHVLALTVVLMDGTVIELGGEELDSPGYDLLGLLVGSEGQLGIITEATVRLLPVAEGGRPILLGFDSVSRAGECVAAIMAAGLIPVALEVLDRTAIEACEAFAQAGFPLDVEALLIAEIEGTAAEMEDLLGRITQIAQSFDPSVVRASGSAEESAAIWLGRMSVFGAMGRLCDYYCVDGAVPLGRLPEVLVRIGEIADGYGLRVATVFHAGDGHLQPLILYEANNAAQGLRAEQCGADILRLCLEVGGCLTGEHGVGIGKRDLMREQFTEADLAQQMRLKSAFDPAWLLNPDKLFPPDAREFA